MKLKILATMLLVTSASSYGNSTSQCPLTLIENLAGIGLNAEATLKKQVFALPSRILNTLCRDLKEYFFEAIERKYAEINTLEISKDGISKYIRGFDVLPSQPSFDINGSTIQLNPKGQILLGHMPDRALLLDMQMSLAAFNIVKREGISDQSDDELLRNLSDGSIDPRNLMSTDTLFNLSKLQTEIESQEFQFREYAILKQFELDFQNILANQDDIYAQKELIRRNQKKDATQNWKLDLLLDGSMGDRILKEKHLPQRLAEQVLHTPDLSAIVSNKGFSNLIKNITDDLEKGAITFIHCKSGQGRSATVVAAVYIESILRKLNHEQLRTLKQKSIQKKIINDVIKIVEDPITGRIQAKISRHQRPVLANYLTKRVLDLRRKPWNPS